MLETQSRKNEPNTTDATMGKSLRSRVEIRKAELESAIANPGTDKRVRVELEIALSELDGLLAGDLDNIPKVISPELSRWLEANKHIDEHHPSGRAPIEAEHHAVCVALDATKPAAS